MRILPIVLLLSVCFTVSGCGGGGGGSSPAPTTTAATSPLYTASGETALYSPLDGTYTATWSQSGSATTGTFTLVLSNGADPTGLIPQYNVLSASLDGIPPFTTIGSSTYSGYAPVAPDGNVFLNTAGTAITEAKFVFPEGGSAGAISYFPLYMTLNISSTGAISGVISTPAQYQYPAQTFNVTLSKS